jgi:hypothetical protein
MEGNWLDRGTCCDTGFEIAKYLSRKGLRNGHNRQLSLLVCVYRPELEHPVLSRFRLRGVPDENRYGVAHVRTFAYGSSGEPLLALPPLPDPT